VGESQGLLEIVQYNKSSDPTEKLTLCAESIASTPGARSPSTRREDDGRVVIGLGCIGGTLEERESPVAALQRELIPRSAFLELVGTPKVFHSLYSTHRYITDSMIAQLQLMSET
jgi:hypothetical protein